MTHFEAVLHERGWDTMRFERELLQMPLTRYLTSHNIDQAYQLFKRRLENLEIRS